MDIGAVKEILAYWGESPREVEIVRDIFRIRTDNGVRCLKKSNKNLDRVLFMMDAMDYVQGQGFSNLARCYPTQNKEMAVTYQGSVYYLQQWLEGRELDYHNLEDMVLAAEVLGRFHRASIGFIPHPGYQAKNKLGKWPKKLRERTADLRKYLSLARDRLVSGGFEEILLKHGNWLLYHAEKSIERLSQSHYQDLVDEARDWGGLVHGDTASRNFIRQGKNIFMIDFDAIALDIFVTDLWRLLRRTLSRGRWEPAAAEQILNAYHNYVPIEPRHKEVLGAFLQFPEIPWRIINKYFQNENHTRDYQCFLTNKLKCYLEQQREIDSFTKSFI
ncbi:MAG: CotS family spore coat protein [Bacillota bacterium]|jgi:CotS family spore coat protein|nr:CotS family spore coat protein [Clostridia bacterium]